MLAPVLLHWQPSHGVFHSLLCRRCQTRPKIHFPSILSLVNLSVFTGEKGQDVVSWLRTVEDYLEFVTCSERQAIAYVILLLSGNARIWWDSEFLSRGNKRPESLEEFKVLLRTQFESPVRETTGQD